MLNGSLKQALFGKISRSQSKPHRPPAGISNGDGETPLQYQTDRPWRINSRTIQVTLEDPLRMSVHFFGCGAGANATPILTGNPATGFSGQLDIQLTDTNPSPTFTS